MDKNRFRSSTKKTLALRAGYLCSNPNCRNKTSGPHKEDHKAINIGVAAHIRGANPGSARYDDKMTPEERSNIINGIWLCTNCSKLIDDDEKKFTLKVLYKWKENHETHIEKELNGLSPSFQKRELILEKFKGEHPAARQIAIDKPEHWEFLLAAELLRNFFKEKVSQYENIHKGLALKKSKYIPKDNFLDWSREKNQDFTNLISYFKVVAEEELIKSFGDLGVAGDEFEILKACNLFKKGYDGIIAWELDLWRTIFPTELKSLKHTMQGWPKQMLYEMGKIHQEITKPFLIDPKPEGTFRINLKFDSPDGLDTFVDDLKKLF